MRPPPPLVLNRYPVTAVTGALAILATLAWWAKVDVGFLMSDYRSFSGEPWRLFGSVLLHADLLHLVFNLYWLWVFGTCIEEVFGRLKTAALLLWLAAGSMALAGVFGEDGVGLSGVGYGLFGLLYVLSQRDERFADAVDKRTTMLFVVWFFICIVMTVTGIYRVANIAHGGGAVVGYLTALVIGLPIRVVWRLALALLSLTLLMAAGFFARPHLNFFNGRGSDLAQLAYERQTAGDVERSVALYERALAIDAEQAKWWFNLGLAYEATQRLEDADVAFERAAGLSPPGSRFSKYQASRTAIRAWDLFHQGDLDEAARLYEKATELNPNDAESWFSLGLIAKKRNRIGEARRAFQRAVESKPDNEKYERALKALEGGE